MRIFAEQILDHRDMQVSMNMINWIGSTFDTHYHQHLLYVLRNFMPPDTAYVEIGTLKGGTIALMAKHHRHMPIIGIDIFKKHSIASVKNLLTAQGVNPGRYQLVSGLSYEKYTEVYQKLRGTKIGMLLIDGDHTGDAVYRDFNEYFPMVAKNGLIVFDDAEHKFVKICIDRIVQENSHSIRIIDKTPNKFKIPTDPGYPIPEHYISLIMQKK